DGGHLLHLFRMDGATPANSRIATEKGRTAAETRRSTAMWEERIKGGRTAMLRMPGVTPIQGGLPIVIDGECIGALGVSGVQSHEDEQIAKAGIAVLTSYFFSNGKTDCLPRPRSHRTSNGGAARRCGLASSWIRRQRRTPRHGRSPWNHRRFLHRTCV